MSSGQSTPQTDLVHLPHISVALRVGDLEVLKLSLQILELLGDPFILLRQVCQAQRV